MGTPNDQERREIRKRYIQDHIYLVDVERITRNLPGFESNEFHPQATPLGISAAAALLDSYTLQFKHLIPFEDKNVGEQFKKHIGDTILNDEVANERAMLVSTWGDYCLFINRTLKWHMIRWQKNWQNMETLEVHSFVDSKFVIEEYIMDSGPYEAGNIMGMSPSSVVRMIVKGLREYISNVLTERQKRIDSWNSVLELIDRAEAWVDRKYLT